MSDDREDPLVEAALTATEGGDVDWELLERLVPEERETIQELAALSEIVAAQKPGVEEEAHDESDAAEPFRWGPLEVSRRIGSGTFGDVYLAWDPRLHREVALKLRRAGAPERSKRWLEEARRLARVRHPNVVLVYGADLHDARAGMWMEPVLGRTLEDRVRQEGPLSAREAALIGAELCGALAAVHAEGLVHGDVKTHNVMRQGVPGQAREAGRIVLMDFGSAHESTSDDARGPATPLFTAPEVLAGERTSPSADLWSLGVVLYRLVTGRWPFEAETLEELKRRLAAGGPTPLRSVRSELPAGFVAAVERALERDPARRWSGAAELERELLAVLGTGEDAAQSVRLRARQRRRGAALWAAAGVVLLGAGTWLGLTRGERAWRSWRLQEQSLAGGLVADLSGSSANGFFGDYVMNVGDLNDDGHDEVAISAPGTDNGGELLIVTPDLSGLRPILTLKGEHPGDWFGTVTSGDLDGDGHRDLVVSAINHDTPSGLRDAGRVYIYFGGAQMDSVPDLILDGTQPAQLFGYGVSCGDVNGDGRDDLIVGAPHDRQATPFSGRAWVYFGGPGFDLEPDLELATGRENSNFGLTVAAAGDLNGDGYGDLVVGASNDAGGGIGRGAAYVYFGGPKLDDRPDLILNGPIDHSGFGPVRQRTGDLNGDGYDDLVVEAETGDGMEKRAGEVLVYFGGPNFDGKPDLRIEGEHRGDGFGTWVDGSQDLDGDGDADLMIGALWHDLSPTAQGAGRAYVYLGGKRFDTVPDFVVDGVGGAELGYGCLVPGRGGHPGHLVVGLKNDTRALTVSGAAQLWELGRWLIQPPQPLDGWAPGRTVTLRWTGTAKTDVSLSSNGGRTWRTIARDAGGQKSNAVRMTVPAEARISLRVRLSRGKDIAARDFALGSP